MADMTEGYPFIYVMDDKECYYNKQIKTLQYRFKSTKSNHAYIVRVEKYENSVYCLKFYDKAMRYSRDRFSLRTNTFEPRTIFYTLYHIMIDVLKKDEKASFFFIGAQDEKDELGVATRRFRIYRKFVSSVISDKLFVHYRINELSLYILVNKKAENPVELSNMIVHEVRLAYES